MSLKEMISKMLGDWVRQTGPEPDVVLSSRVRLARNIEKLPFPHMADDEQKERVVRDISDMLRGRKRLKGMKMMMLEEIEPIDRQTLVERHLISPQHIQDVKNRAVVLRDDDMVSIMVNEEDHLRIQTIFPGFQLEESLALASEVDDSLEMFLDYAFDENVGYITACPTNLGTGLRASVMVHLPALSLANQLNNILGAVSRVGLVIRGMYGEGTESAGNIFQISNQVSLGPTEQEIVNNIKIITKQIIDHERNARQYLVREIKSRLEDRVYRAFGILANARMITSDEVLKHLSDVRLGIDLGIIDGIDSSVMNELTILTKPAHLQKFMGRELNPDERDLYRATLVRERLKLEEDEQKGRNMT